jgi:hypothetical protein
VKGRKSWGFLSDGAWVSFPTTNGPLRLGDTARANAARAHTHAFPGFADDYMNVLKVWIPAPFCEIVGMTDPMPVNRTFIANLTASHEGNSFEK